jgi:hypothetical protein
MIVREISFEYYERPEFRADVLDLFQFSGGAIEVVSSFTPYYAETKARQKETGIQKIGDLLAMDLREISCKHIGAFDAEVEPLLDGLKTLQQAVERDLTYAQIYLPPLPVADVQGFDHPPPFDSTRSYMEQLRYYKNGNGGST